MKIQIIKLESHDDLLSARDKLSWSKAGRVLVVWPSGSQILDRRLDLVLLKRTCLANGSQIGIVTEDLQVRKIAQDLGIPYFGNEAQALKTRWKTKRQKEITERPFPIPDIKMLKEEIDASAKGKFSEMYASWMDRKWVKITCLSVGILSIFILFAAFFPSATVTVEPVNKIQTVNLDIFANSQVKSVNISGVIPVHTVSVIVEGNGSLQTTGSLKIPDHLSSGRVVFTNLSDQFVNIPAGTVVETTGKEGVRFLTTQNRQIAAGPGTTLVVLIRAIQPGPGGNLQPGKVNTIEGELGLILSVTNKEAITGGDTKVVQAASEADYEKLRDQVIQSLQSLAIAQIRAKMASGDKFIANSIQIKDVLDEQSDPGLNQPADELTINLRLEFSGSYLSKSDLDDLGQMNLDAVLPPTFSTMNENITVEEVGLPVIDQDRTIQWKFTASRQIQENLNYGQVTQLIIGLTPNAAQELVSAILPVMNEPDIIIDPSWWPRMPIFSFRILIKEVSGAIIGS